MSSRSKTVAGISRSRLSKTLSKIRCALDGHPPIERVRPASRAALAPAILHAQLLLFRQLRVLLILLRNRLVHAAGRRIHRRRHDGDRPRVDPRERESVWAAACRQTLRSAVRRPLIGPTDDSFLRHRRLAGSRAATRSAARTTAGLPTTAAAECRCRTGVRFLQRALRAAKHSETQATKLAQEQPLPHAHSRGGSCAAECESAISERALGARCAIVRACRAPVNLQSSAAPIQRRTPDHSHRTRRAPAATPSTRRR